MVAETLPNVPFGVTSAISLHVYAEASDWRLESMLDVQ